MGVPGTILPTVFLVGTDLLVRKRVESACGLLGVSTQTFGDGIAFLDSYRESQAGCVIAELAAPHMSGLELQRRMSVFALPPPVIFVTSSLDLRVVVAAMTNGAQTILEKPPLLDELTGHIREALSVDAITRANSRRKSEGEERLGSLTDKEREVLDLVVRGYTNRQVSEMLHISVRAVEDRRARLMRKLEVKSVAELVRAAQ